MDPTAPEGCAGADHGWAGNPLDTAHLRLKRGDAPQSIIAEDRLSGAVIGNFSWNFKDQAAAQLHASWSDAAYAAESLSRCLRMLFVNFGVALVELEISPENQSLTSSFCDLGFNRDLVLTRENWLAWRADRKHLLVVAAALIDADGRVLLARRPAGKSMAGQWEFPGGKIVAGETPEQALVRELREELGIDVTESCLAPLAFASHDYDHFHLVMPLFALRQWQGQVAAQEGQALAWVAKERLSAYPMPPADIPLVAALRDWL
jgi:8-oxo-dGTP diphosphatase